MTEDLVEITDPHFIIDMMYSRTNNMLGTDIYKQIGYGNHAYMRKQTRDALLSLIPVLEENNLKMRICDAYRPPLAHQKMLEIIPMEGFFAKTPDKSNHCHGTAVDVCLTDINGNNLIYPTEIDAYDKEFQKQIQNNQYAPFLEHLKKARHDNNNCSQLALENRHFLKNLMETHGFEAITHEWWHYNLKDWQNYPLIDWQNYPLIDWQ